MKKSIFLKASLAFILVGGAVVKATPASSSSFEIRYTGSDSELTERHTPVYDEESTYNLLWDSLAGTSEDEDAAEKRALADGLQKRDNCNFDVSFLSAYFTVNCFIFFCLIISVQTHFLLTVRMRVFQVLQYHPKAMLQEVGLQGQL